MITRLSGYANRDATIPWATSHNGLLCDLGSGDSYCLSGPPDCEAFPERLPGSQVVVRWSPAAPYGLVDEEHLREVARQRLRCISASA